MWNNKHLIELAFFSEICLDTPIGWRDFKAVKSSVILQLIFSKWEWNENIRFTFRVCLGSSALCVPQQKVIQSLFHLCSFLYNCSSCQFEELFNLMSWCSFELFLCAFMFRDKHSQNAYKEDDVCLWGHRSEPEMKTCPPNGTASSAIFIIVLVKMPLFHRVLIGVLP